jgi:hypothetical protein
MFVSNYLLWKIKLLCWIIVQVVMDTTQALSRISYNRPTPFSSIRLCQGVIELGLGGDSY